MKRKNAWRSRRPWPEGESLARLARLARLAPPPPLLDLQLAAAAIDAEQEEETSSSNEEGWSPPSSSVGVLRNASSLLRGPRVSEAVASVTTRAVVDGILVATAALGLACKTWSDDLLVDFAARSPWALALGGTAAALVLLAALGRVLPERSCRRRARPVGEGAGGTPPRRSWTSSWHRRLRAPR